MKVCELCGGAFKSLGYANHRAACGKRLSTDMAAALAVVAKYPDACLTADAIAGYAGRTTVTRNTVRALERRQLITAHGSSHDQWYSITANGRRAARATPAGRQDGSA